MRLCLTVTAVATLVLAFCQSSEGQYDNAVPPQWAVGQGNPFYRDKYCPPDARWPCDQLPFYPYDEIDRTIPNTGIVVGRSLIFAPHKYINIFRGVPYARPPYGERRFKRPERPGPGWDMGIRKWDASFYRDACPQELWRLQEKFYEMKNTSEDCLHLNIFSPNITDRLGGHNRNRLYPVLVYVHGEDFNLGDSALYPAHILAKREVVVITFNYRLGALGFMSTSDDYSRGNYGLYDIVEVLEFIQSYIRIFRGDPNRVTLMGSGSGAASIGLLMVSPKTQRSRSGGQKLFQQVILMAGSDLCDWTVVGPHYFSNPLEYTQELGRRVGCDPDYGVPMEILMECLRSKHFDEIVNASASVWRKYGSLSGPFGPVLDGPDGLLPKTPAELRKGNNVMKVNILAGVTRDEGAYIAENVTKDILGLRIAEGMSPGTFRDIIDKMIRERPLVLNIDEVVGAVEFEYTFWAKPDNTSAVRQNLIDLYSDMMYGSCVDSTLKAHLKYTETFDNSLYMYVFEYRSEYEQLPYWMGVPHGKDVDYLFGHPFFNMTLGNLTGVVPGQLEWTELDRNISEFVQNMWLNFTLTGVPTPDWERNVSWYEMTPYNLSFLRIGEWSYMDINYRQNHYAFWRDYFPTVASRYPVTTTPIPTPRPRIEYETATWSLVGVAVITIFIIVALAITLWRRGRQTFL
ncbi:hypothetical protein NP493_1299g00052 [Ridgeia piscesae]|uniref:Carboxylesterase type B domain-containing protein n=1 Tax=Ridgeia piscesae TaxID=27915 RepID=A0AAD9NEC5_RIDPI|nr:hypothetical protein NP493_1299g00052 [Ridgeia piscesae]